MPNLTPQQMQAAAAAAAGASKLYTEFFAFASTRKAVAAGAANVTDFIQLQADADFLIEKITFMADIAGAAQTDSSRVVPNVLVLLTSTSSSKALTNVAVPISSIAGYGALPFILPKPYYLTGNSTLQIQYTSNEAVNANNIQMVFIGRKVYRYDNTTTQPRQ